MSNIKIQMVLGNAWRHRGLNRKFETGKVYDEDAKLAEALLAIRDYGKPRFKKAADIVVEENYAPVQIPEEFFASSDVVEVVDSTKVDPVTAAATAKNRPSKSNK